VAPQIRARLADFASVPAFVDALVALADWKMNKGRIEEVMALVDAGEKEIHAGSFHDSGEIRAALQRLSDVREACVESALARTHSAIRFRFESGARTSLRLLATLPRGLERFAAEAEEAAASLLAAQVVPVLEALRATSEGTAAPGAAISAADSLTAVLELTAGAIDDAQRGVAEGGTCVDDAIGWQLSAHIGRRLAGESLTQVNALCLHVVDALGLRTLVASVTDAPDDSLDPSSLTDLLEEMALVSQAFEYFARFHRTRLGAEPAVPLALSDVRTMYTTIESAFVERSVRMGIRRGVVAATDGKDLDPAALVVIVDVCFLVGSDALRRAVTTCTPDVVVSVLTSLRRGLMDELLAALSDVIAYLTDTRDEATAAPLALRAYQRGRLLASRLAENVAALADDMGLGEEAEVVGAVMSLCRDMVFMCGVRARTHLTTVAGRTDAAALLSLVTGAVMRSRTEVDDISIDQCYDLLLRSVVAGWEEAALPHRSFLVEVLARATADGLVARWLSSEQGSWQPMQALAAASAAASVRDALARYADEQVRAEELEEEDLVIFDDGGEGPDAPPPLSIRLGEDDDPVAGIRSSFRYAIVVATALAATDVNDFVSLVAGDEAGVALSKRDAVRAARVSAVVSADDVARLLGQQVAPAAGRAPVASPVKESRARSLMSWLLGRSSPAAAAAEPSPATPVPRTPPPSPTPHASSSRLPPTSTTAVDNLMPRYLDFAESLSSPPRPTTPTPLCSAFADGLLDEGAEFPVSPLPLDGRESPFDQRPLDQLFLVYAQETEEWREATQGGQGAMVL
jgi:hypothetical protein